MATIISHATKNELGKVTGGTAGDQTGQEVRSENWYNGNWTSIFRFKDKTLAKKVADFVVKCANNNNIGYNQDERYTLFEELSRNSWNVDKITIPVSCDCSSLIMTACRANGLAVDKYMYTGNEESKLLGSGAFVKITDTAYTQKSDKLEIGDILLKNGHTAMVTATDNAQTGVWMDWVRFEGTYSYGDARALYTLGDAGRAYGMYQFDYRYGLVPFMQRCIAKDSVYYADFAPFIGLGAGNTTLINNTNLHNLFKKYANERTSEFLSLQNEEGIENYLKPAIAASGYTDANPFILGSIFSFAIRDGANGTGATAAYAKIPDLQQMYDAMFAKYPDLRWNSSTTSPSSQYSAVTATNRDNFVFDIYSGGDPIQPLNKKVINPLWILALMGYQIIQR